jgi:thiamine-phosphate pyrophosphorylase
MIDKASYLAIGPVWETPTKAGRPGIGLKVTRTVLEEARIPAFAIGGIDASNIGEVIAAGARRVAVCRAVIAAKDPASAARELKEKLAAAGDHHPRHRGEAP